jgi:hypothetical protein
MRARRELGPHTQARVDRSSDALDLPCSEILLDRLGLELRIAYLRLLCGKGRRECDEQNAVIDPVINLAIDLVVGPVMVASYLLRSSIM